MDSHCARVQRYQQALAAELRVSGVGDGGELDPDSFAPKVGADVLCGDDFLEDHASHVVRQAHERVESGLGGVWVEGLDVSRYNGMKCNIYV